MDTMNKANVDSPKKDTKPTMFREVSIDSLKSFRDLIGEEIARREQDTADSKGDKLSEMSASEFAAYVDKTLSENKSRAIDRRRKA
jgi:hypothetical protein